MPAVVPIYSKHAGCVLRLLNRTDYYVWLYQKNLWLFMFEMHLISGITEGVAGVRTAPQATRWKTGPLSSLYFGTILLVSVDCFFACLGVFSGDFVFFNCRSIPDLLLFLTYFLSVGQWAPFSYVSLWLKPLVTSLHLIKA